MRLTRVLPPRPLREVAVVALLALLLASTLSGCFTVAAVDAPSGPTSSAYAVTLTVVPDERAAAPLRGVVAVRFPQEWTLRSATYSGAYSGALTFSDVMARYFATDWEEEGGWPGLSGGEKPGTKWWAGYSAVHPGDAVAPLTVRLVFDQNGWTGAASLDFVTGVADADDPEDATAANSAWDLGGIAADRPVSIGPDVPVKNVPPWIGYGEERSVYAPVGEPVSDGGFLFDPDSDPAVTVEYGDGASESLVLEPFDFAFAVWGWEWEHTWETKGSYTVRVTADDGQAQSSDAAVVHVGQSPFPDVSPAHEFFPAIVELWQKGIVGGYVDGMYRPNDPVIRAQVAKMVSVAFGLHDDEITNQAAPTFRDVPYTGTAYPFDFVEEAAAGRLVNGFTDGTFRPWSQLSRIQLVRILVRAAGEVLKEPGPSYRLPFADVASADERDLALAHYNGLVNGKAATRFAPYATATRGHVAQILYRTLNLEPRLSSAR